MAAATAKISGSAAAKGAAAESKGIVLEQAANEFVFAVVGHVGSGTSEIATALKGLLSGATRRMKIQHTPAVRASITFPPDLYGALEELAKLKKVS